MTDATFETSPWSAAQRALSVVLVLFTLLVGLVCVLMLSCTLTQARMSTIALSGVNVSVWKLDDIRKRWQTLRDQIDKQAAVVATAEGLKADAAAESAAHDAIYKSARTSLDAKLGAFVQRLEGADPALARTMSGQGPVERVESLEGGRTTLLAAHPELTDDLKEIVKLGDPYKAIDQRRIVLHTTRDSRENAATAASKSLDALQLGLDNLFSAQFGVKPIDPAVRARIENALFELYSGGALGEMLHSLLILSPEILSLFLVVLMGILGSSLQITHQLFIRREPNSIGVYALRLCVGAITALVIFIVAKAGVPIVADGSKFGGDTPINPYFVSFLAIISGLMSEQAIISVQTQAAKYFSGGTFPEQVRWARPDLETAVEKTQRDRGDLAKHLEVSATTLDDWLSAKAPVTLHAQQMLAAILDGSVRDLFSDLPQTCRQICRPKTSQRPRTRDRPQNQEGRRRWRKAGSRLHRRHATRRRRGILFGARDGWPIQWIGRQAVAKPGVNGFAIKTRP